MTDLARRTALKSTVALAAGAVAGCATGSVLALGGAPP